MGCSVRVHYADINQKSSKATVFRTYQGWLALSETAPTEGTLQVFPNVIMSNAYMILRPFVSPKEGASPESYDPNDWQFGTKKILSSWLGVRLTYPCLVILDISNPDFPGIYSWQGAFVGPRPNTKTHPHLKLDETMVSVPKVYPGDMVFWHCVRIS